MKIEDMTLEELKAYKASVEVYGTAKELYDITIMIKEKENE